MLRVALVRDFDEERLFGVRLYAERLRRALDGRCDVFDVYPRPRRGPGTPVGRSLATFAVKEILYPLAARRIVADVAHVVDQSHAHLARWIRRAPTVVTCHDLWGLRFGTAVRRWGYRRRMLGLFAAARVIAVSETTRRQVIALGVSAERVAVVRNRVDAVFLETPSDAELGAARERFALRGGATVLHVGNTLPYKNFEGLLRALGAIRRLHRREIPLLKVGNEPTTLQRKLAAREGVEVRFVGIVSQLDLRALYHLADCLVYPSLDEGFGWPVAEAIACGRPVIAGRAGALPEVAAEAALLVDPEDPQAIASAVLRVLDDSKVRAELAARARDRRGWLVAGDVGAEVHEVYEAAAAR